MTEEDLLADIAAAREECEAAVSTILEALQRILRQADDLAEREPAAVTDLRAAGTSILEACAFQDLVGQRLTRVAGLGSTDPLLEGPAKGGAGLRQDEIDLWMDSSVV